MGVYRELTGAGVTTRTAAELAGVPRATATRRAGRPEPQAGARPAPANRLTEAEQAEVLAALNSPRFVDQAPIQVYATLLDEGRYLCSISTM